MIINDLLAVLHRRPVDSGECSSEKDPLQEIDEDINGPGKKIWFFDLLINI